mmetsp:Transcript_2782/g.3377  ORF Transcript_2782/g.3377 Transcript_2782/m.3377 type:complete len:136 (-) Transcript_2782:33-440(-)
MPSNDVESGVIQGEVVHATPIVQPNVVQATVVAPAAAPAVQATIVSPTPPAVNVQFFGDAPQMAHCPRCNTQVQTNVIPEVSNGTHLFFLIMIAVFCVTCFPLCCCVYCFPCFKEKVHFCSKCNNLLGRKEFICH